MNIFVVNSDPELAARDLCDQHIVKMPVETAQMLCTLQLANGIPAPWKATHSKHICTVWAGVNKANWQWLYEHGLALCSEYNRRYHKTHKAELILRSLVQPKNDGSSRTEFVQAMPDEFRVTGDAISAYRRYYIGSKIRFARWRHSVRPDWTN